MKYHFTEIAWHNVRALTGVDIHPLKEDGAYKLVTCSMSSNLRIWHISIKLGKIEDSETVSVKFRSHLSAHKEPVNVVRWSPKGNMIASGDNESSVFVWKQKFDDPDAPPDIFDDTDVPDDMDPNEETWVVYKRLYKHMKEVTDLCWSPGGDRLASVSVDKSVIIFEVETGKATHILKDFRNFPNGICWDPLGRYMAVQALDRLLRVYDSEGESAEFQKIAIVGKLDRHLLPSDLKCHKSESDTTIKLFHDETLWTFVRRPQFSPDGELLLASAGQFEFVDLILNTVYIFTRYDFEKPALILTLPEESPALATRFCPTYYVLDKEAPNTLGLPYRMVFAVLTLKSILFYDTQQCVPFACVGEAHYGNFTDIAWSSDGQMIIASSLDGYCSIITFCNNDFGKIIAKKDLPLPPRQKTPETTQESVADSSAPSSAESELEDEVIQWELEELERENREPMLEEGDDGLVQERDDKEQDSSGMTMSAADEDEDVDEDDDGEDEESDDDNNSDSSIQILNDLSLEDKPEKMDVVAAGADDNDDNESNYVQIGDSGSKRQSASSRTTTTQSPTKLKTTIDWDDLSCTEDLKNAASYSQQVASSEKKPKRRVNFTTIGKI